MEEKNSGAVRPVARRQMAAWVVLALFSRMVRPQAWAASRRQATQQVPATEANAARTSLHQEVEFGAIPARIYAALLSAKEFAAFTGMQAETDARAGGGFSMFGGMVVGRNVELVAGQRIVQAWRRTTWEPGVYSMVKFELKAKGAGTTVVLDHTGFPKGAYEGLYSGWGERYWDPLRKYLA